MTFYVTKYALTDGVQVKEGEICSEISDSMIRVEGETFGIYHKPDWYLDRAEAVARAEPLPDWRN